MHNIVVTRGSRGIGLAISRRLAAACDHLIAVGRREVGELGITVNAIAPAFVDTELTQSLAEDQRKRIAGRSALRRLPETDDVARMVEYLLGDGGRNITGSVLTIDAGNTA